MVRLKAQEDLRLLQVLAYLEVMFLVHTSLQLAVEGEKNQATPNSNKPTNSCSVANLKMHSLAGN